MSDGPAWRIHLFGNVRVTLSGEPTPTFNNRKVAQLLAYLATSPTNSHTRESLAELLWPGEYLEISRDRLRQTLALLNKHFKETGKGTPIIADRHAISLDVTQVAIDLSEFRALLKAPGPDTWRRAESLSARPIAEGWTDDWVKALRYEVENQLLQTGKGLMDDEGVLERCLKRFWLDEAIHLARYENLLSQGKRTEAALVARDYADRLKQELGLEPSQAWHLSPAFTQTFKAHGIKFNDLPMPVDRFFGREQDIARLKANLDSRSDRLHTVTGPGGAGKTRLIAEVLSTIEGYENIIAIGLADLDSANQFIRSLANILETNLDENLETNLGETLGTTASTYCLTSRLSSTTSFN